MNQNIFNAPATVADIANAMTSKADIIKSTFATGLENISSEISEIIGSAVTEAIESNGSIGSLIEDTKWYYDTIGYVLMLIVGIILVILCSTLFNTYISYYYLTDRSQNADEETKLHKKYPNINEIGVSNETNVRCRIL